MFHPFLLSCVVWSSSRIFSATDHGTNTFQNTHCWGGVWVANATKRPPRGQSKMASRNKQLGETEVQAVRKGVFIYVYIYVIYNVCIQNTLTGIVVKTLQCWAFVWECGTSWISYMSDSCFLSPPSGLRIKMLGLPCNQRVVSYSYQNSQNHSVYSMKRIGTFSWKPDPIDLKCNFGTPRAWKRPKFKREGLLAYDLHLTHDSSICPVLHSETIRSFVHVQIVHGQLAWRDHVWTPSIHQRVSYRYRPGKCQR